MEMAVGEYLNPGSIQGNAIFQEKWIVKQLTLIVGITATQVKRQHGTIFIWPERIHPMGNHVSMAGECGSHAPLSEKLQ